VREGGLLLTDKLSTHFALGKAYLDTGDSARAFHHLDTGNRLKRSTFAYDSQTAQQWTQSILCVALKWASIEIDKLLEG